MGIVKFAAACRIAMMLLCVSASVAWLGCGGAQHPKTTRVTGSVAYKGQPVDGAQVMFYCKTGRPAEGVTDAAGHFTLTTFRGSDGALVGEHSVTISKPIAADSKAEKAAIDNPHAPSSDEHRTNNTPRQAIPSRYASPSQSPLRATVTLAGSNDFRFDLTD